MCPRISWSALADTPVGLWGLGMEGTASLRRLRVMGVAPVLVDDAPPFETLDGLPVHATAAGGLAALLSCRVVIKSPGISRTRPEVAQLEAAGIAVCGGLGLWMEEADRHKVACITGTKGKSTTTALAVHLLGGLGYSAAAGGNIGRPPWDPEGGPEPEYWVIETSSFQVPDLGVGPAVVAVTSLFPDHLDWHGDEVRYYADKLSLCTKPEVGTVLAASGDPVLHAHADALGPAVVWVDPRDPSYGGPWLHEATRLLPGEHNRRNAAMARAVLRALGVAGADDDAAMGRAVQGFTGLPSRCHSIGSVGRVEFVDDSLSTNVLPARAALEAYADRPVALLVGGHDRGVDYGPLAEAVAARGQPTLVVTMPDNGPRIGRAIRAGAAGSGDGAVTVRDAAGLDEAVTLAFAWAVDGTVVLLSPAAPSFGRFADYRDRSRAFAAAAAGCGPLS